MVMKLLDRLRGRSTAIDPVCHMEVDTKNPPGGTLEHDGETYYFCGPGCRLNFEEDPAGYVSGEKHEKM